MRRFAAAVEKANEEVKNAGKPFGKAMELDDPAMEIKSRAAVCGLEHSV